MTRDDDMRSQVEALLRERTLHGKGWFSLPSVDPIFDLPSILATVKANGGLDGVTIKLTPSLDGTGWWDVLVILPGAEGVPA